MNKINFVNNSTPDLDASTLNQMQTNIETAINANTTQINANTSAIANKANKKIISNALSTMGWYRIAKFSGSSIGLISIQKNWNNNIDQNILMLIENNTNNSNIKVLYSSEPYGFTKARIVTENSNTYLEVYYRVNLRNNVIIELETQIDTITLVNFEQTSEDVGTVRKSIDIINNSFVDNNNITTGTEYATNEYIDNKRVYRKRIDIGKLPNASTKSVPHGLTNVTFVRFNGITKDTGYYMHLPSVSNTPANCITLSISENNVMITTGIDRSSISAWVDLYYTKN